MHNEDVDDRRGDVRQDSTEPVRTRSKGLNSLAQQRLGLHLRTMYQSIVQEAVPDRFTDLVARLGDDTPDLEENAPSP